MLARVVGDHPAPLLFPRQSRPNALTAVQSSESPGGGGDLLGVMLSREPLGPEPGGEFTQRGGVTGSAFTVIAR